MSQVINISINHGKYKFSEINLAQSVPVNMSEQTTKSQARGRLLVYHKSGMLNLSCRESSWKCA